MFEHSTTSILHENGSQKPLHGLTITVYTALTFVQKNELPEKAGPYQVRMGTDTQRNYETYCHNTRNSRQSAAICKKTRGESWPNSTILKQRRKASRQSKKAWKKLVLILKSVARMPTTLGIILLRKSQPRGIPYQHRKTSHPRRNYTTRRQT